MHDVFSCNWIFVVLHLNFLFFEVDVTYVVMNILYSGVSAVTLYRLSHMDTPNDL